MERSASDTESSYSEEEVYPSICSVLKNKTKRFTAAQQSCLIKYWSNGLTSCSKRLSHTILNASKDTGLNCDQVKVK